LKRKEKRSLTCDLNIGYLDKSKNKRPHSKYLRDKMKNAEKIYIDDVAYVRQKVSKQNDSKDNILDT
jgi:ribosome maturation factor RimP